MKEACFAESVYGASGMASVSSSYRYLLTGYVWCMKCAGTMDRDWEVCFMNISKFTQKSIEAVNNLEKVAYQFGHQEIEEEHLLYWPATIRKTA